MTRARISIVVLLLAGAFAMEACGSDARTDTAPSSSGSASGSSGGASSGGSSSGTAPSSSSGASGDAGTDAEPSGPPAVRFVGRFDTTDAAAPVCAWPGCRIAARFEGSKLSVRLLERADDWMDGGPSEWDVTIDGVAKPKIVMTLGEKVYELATGLGPGVHSVELYKRSEAHNGTTQFGGFDFGEGGKLLSPPAPASRRIEIIGDSTPASFGIEGTEGSCGLDKAAKNQNFHRSFGARLGEIFGADVHGTVYSGKGLVKNIWRPDTETMPKLFGRANPLVPTSTFALSSFVPDVVVVMLGGLDFAEGQPSDDGPTPHAEFVAAYAQLLATMRGAYATTQILAVVSPSVVDYDGRPIRTSLVSGVTAAVDQRRAAGDADVTLVMPPLATPAELTGCGGHGNPAFHERLAQDLATSVRTKTSWK